MMAKQLFQNYEIRLDRKQLVTAESKVFADMLSANPRMLEYLIPIMTAFTNLNQYLYHPDLIPEIDPEEFDELVSACDFEEE